MINIFRVAQECSYLTCVRTIGFAVRFARKQSFEQMRDKKLLIKVVVVVVKKRTPRFVLNCLQSCLYCLSY